MAVPRVDPSPSLWRFHRLNLAGVSTGRKQGLRPNEAILFAVSEPRATGGI